MDSLTVFFPAYNEEATVRQALDSILSVVPRLTDDYEVMVVNDGSTDRTPEIAEEYARKDAHVRLISHKNNLGYGSALQSGFKAATKDYVFYTDGDLQFDIKELLDFWYLRREADMICGYRMERKDRPIRIVYAAIHNFILRILFGLRMTDVDCAFKMFRREIFDRIKMEATGALINAEIMIRARRLGYTMRERGVYHFPRKAGTRSGEDVKVVLRAARELSLFLMRKGSRRIVKRILVTRGVNPSSKVKTKRFAGVTTGTAFQKHAEGGK